MLKVSDFTELMALNFHGFFIAHTAHVITKGSYFEPDHELLQEVYEGLYGYHDVLAEQAMICGMVYPFSCLEDMAKSCECELTGRDRKSMFINILTILERIEAKTKSVFAASSDMPGLNTVIGDYAAAVSKLRWKVSCVIQ
mgnify:CR=1 FL=1